ncbi:MAG: hypothetical protein J6A59_04135 [Lachnospiraceae bacterium]|nr:hypothetical protein [Lachnospiraceae bacterium]
MNKVGACIRCGVSVNSSDNICDSCRNRNITLSKLYEFYEQTKETEQIEYSNYELNREYIVHSNKSCWYWWIIWPAYVSIIPIIDTMIITCMMLIMRSILENDTAFIITIVMSFAIAFIVTLVSFIWLKRIYSDDIYSKESNKQNKLRELNQKIIENNNKIKSIFINSNQYVPFNYKETHIVMALIQLIESNRADSLKEAINLYESIKYTDSMLSLQKEMSENARVSAIANVATAVSTYGVYKNTRR